MSLLFSLSQSNIKQSLLIPALLQTSNDLGPQTLIAAWKARAGKNERLPLTCNSVPTVSQNRRSSDPSIKQVRNFESLITQS